MNNDIRLLKKEFRLSASVLSFFFMLGSAFCMIPNYPCIVGAFFVCLGIFYSFQNAREANDSLYTVLLPVAKKETVRAKLLFTASVQLMAFALFAVFTAVRNALGPVPPYDQDVLMRPGLVLLGYVLIVYSLFNMIFVCGFYRTAYKLGRPFILFAVAAFLFIVLTEAVHHIPGLEFLNSADAEHVAIHATILAVCVAIYAVSFSVSLKVSENRFEKLDL